MKGRISVPIFVVVLAAMAITAAVVFAVVDDDEKSASVVIAPVPPSEPTIDEEKTERKIRQSLEDETGERVDSVECPEGVPIQAQRVFECQVDVAGRDTEIAELKVLNEDADVELIRLGQP